MTKSKESKVIIEYTHIACSMSDAEDGKGREMTRTGTAMTAPASKGAPGFEPVTRGRGGWVKISLKFFSIHASKMCFSTTRRSTPLYY